MARRSAPCSTPGAVLASRTWLGAPTADLIAFPSALAAQASPSQAAKAALVDFFNNSEDFTRPRNQLQLLQRYQRDPDVGDQEPGKWTTTLRTDLWTDVGQDWLLMLKSAPARLIR